MHDVGLKVDMECNFKVIFILMDVISSSLVVQSHFFRHGRPAC